MSPDLPETCTKYTTTRDRYGGLVLVSNGSLACLYRNIDQLNRGVNFREEVDIQGQFWLASDAGVALGDILSYSGQLFRIENIVKAKDLLLSDQVQFLKCLVSLYRGIS